MATASRVLEIEQHALNAWPAEEVESYAGWQLRAMRGVSRRANSVWTARASGRSKLAYRIAYTETFYASRALPAAFQVGDHSEPPGLDAALASRGYRLDAPVSVQVATTSTLTGRAASDIRVEVNASLNDSWFELSGRRGRFAQVEDVYRRLLIRLGAAALFATAFVDDVPVAVGLGVCSGQWLGISSMLTLAEHRRRGAARSVLCALARHAAKRGQTGVYLQVERDNQAATALYASAGFVHHHGYHYRVQPPDRGSETS